MYAMATLSVTELKEALKEVKKSCTRRRIKTPHFLLSSLQFTHGICLCLPCELQFENGLVYVANSDVFFERMTMVAKIASVG